MRILAIIPARGGSKGIKDKNIINLHGSPLIKYTIDAALGSSYVDRTIVSTDSEKIAHISSAFGADIPFVRPKSLATDTSKTIDVILHALKSLSDNGEKYDTLLLLQPTQPLRTSEDIDKSIEFFFMKGKKGLVSISPVDDNPILMRVLEEDDRVVSLLGLNSTCRRQDMKRYYKVNGCIYINQIDEISKNTSFNDNPIGYIMDTSHSVDIDEEKDLALAEYYLRNMKR